MEVLFPYDHVRLAGDRRRPPFRWFVIGGSRSGTGIHIDPLGKALRLFCQCTLINGHSSQWDLTALAYITLSFLQEHLHGTPLLQDINDGASSLLEHPRVCTIHQ